MRLFHETVDFLFFFTLCALDFQLNEIMEERGKTPVLNIRKMRKALLIGWCSWQEFRKLRFSALSIIMASKLELSFHDYLIRVLGEAAEADSTRDNNCSLIEPLRVPVYQAVNLFSVKNWLVQHISLETQAAAPHAYVQ